MTRAVLQGRGALVSIVERKWQVYHPHMEWVVEELDMSCQWTHELAI